MPTVFTLEGADPEPMYCSVCGSKYAGMSNDGRAYCRACYKPHAAVAPLGEASSDPWFERHPALGAAVALGGPIVLGALIAFGISVVMKKQRRSEVTE
jgi:hypothetical protein